MYAVLETGGKQYRVSKDDTIKVEKLNVNVGDSIELDTVLMINQDGATKVGSPYVKSAKVTAEVLSQGKHDKVIIFKFNAKKDFRKKKGHRQTYTELKITDIQG